MVTEDNYLPPPHYVPYVDTFPKLKYFHRNEGNAALGQQLSCSLGRRAIHVLLIICLYAASN